MNDDLVRRLRCYADIDDAVYNPWVYGEAADRIEKLEAALDEAAFSQTLFDAVVGQRNKATDRIEKLEAALLELSEDWGCCGITIAMRTIARKALEDKQ